MVRICYSFALLLILAASAAAESPVWHGLDGRPIATGTLSSVEGDTVRLLAANRTTAAIQLDRLSAADRAFVITRDDKASEFQHVTRKWTSANGKYHVDAKAITVDDKQVSLTKSDGKLASVPLDKLSADDRAYLARLQQVLTPKDDPFASVEAFVGKPKPSPPVPAQSKTIQPLAANSASKVEADNTTVYVTKSGTKYHSAGCRYLSKSAIPMPLSEAKLKYSPCSVCQHGGQGSEQAASAATQPSLTNSGAASRNPNGEQVTGHTATGIPTFTGPRGGQYHYSKSGKKVYEKKR